MSLSSEVRASGATNQQRRTASLCRSDRLYNMATAAHISIGGVPATYLGGALAPGDAGLEL